MINIKYITLLECDKLMSLVTSEYYKIRKKLYDNKYDDDSDHELAKDFRGEILLDFERIITIRTKLEIYQEEKQSENE